MYTFRVRKMAEARAARCLGAEYVLESYTPRKQKIGESEYAAAKQEMDRPSIATDTGCEQTCDCHLLLCFTFKRLSRRM